MDLPHGLPQHQGVPQTFGQQGRQLAGTAVNQLLLGVVALGSGALPPGHVQQRHLVRLRRPKEADGPAEIGEVPGGEGGVGVGRDPVLEAQAVEGGGLGMVMGMARDRKSVV